MLNGVVNKHIKIVALILAHIKSEKRKFSLVLHTLGYMHMTIFGHMDGHMHSQHFSESIYSR